MIVSRLNFHHNKSSVLIVIIEKDNLDRMKRADPITIEGASRGGKVMPGILFPDNLSLLIAYEEDDVELYTLAKTGDLSALLHWLERGRKFDPKTDGPENVVPVPVEAP